MDTGPRFGDIYIENDFTPGTSDWYRVEANNAKYRENKTGCARGSRLDRLITDLMMMNYGRSVVDMASDFTRK